MQFLFCASHCTVRNWMASSFADSQPLIILSYSSWYLSIDAQPNCQQGRDLSNPGAKWVTESQSVFFPCCWDFLGSWPLSAPITHTAPGVGPLWLQLPPVFPCLLCSSQLLMGSRRLATEDQYFHHAALTALALKENEDILALLNLLLK